MARARSHPWTVEDFLAFESEERERYEFVDGVVRMMTGASAAHSAIKGNVFVELRAALRSGPCRVDVDDLKVVTASAVMYPDVLVICRPISPDDDRVSDPTVVVEVLSPTTQRHDRIGKWREYQRILSPSTTCWSSRRSGESRSIPAPRPDGRSGPSSHPRTRSC
jgi:Uma2 family endonuclease